MAAATLVATLPLALSHPSPAQAADACTTPQLSDFMVSQGLPSYGVLARGKTTLVKFFLNTPSCLPVGATVQVSGAQLTVSSSTDPVLLRASLPLPPLGPPSTAPVAGSASDVLFVVPGSALDPLTENVTFSAKIDYIVSTAAGSLRDSVVFATYPGTTTALSAPVAPSALPFGMLVVPMGDATKSTDSQFPGPARTALENGMTSFVRTMPIADEGQLQWNLNPGMVDLSAYMASGKYCGVATHFKNYISAQLEAKRTSWNSISTNEHAHVAYGQVWQGVSQGQSTDPTVSCLEGAAWVPGNTGWGRTIGDTQPTDPLKGDALTGSIAVMEVAHSTGNVHEDDLRHKTGSHSTSAQADLTAPDRAYNLDTASWISDDRSVQNYSPTGWHDLNTLLEKEDWDWLQCAMLPAVPVNEVYNPNCKPGRLTYAAAGAPGQGTFVISGSTDGTPEGTDAYSYASDNNRFDQPAPDSEYRFVQRGQNGAVLSDTGVPVAFSYSVHDGQTPNHGDVSETGSFGAAVLDASTPLTPVQTIELWRGAPGAPGSTKLYAVTKDAPPSFLSVGVTGSTVTLTATDERPQDLRLDVFVECPSSTAPLSTANEPTVIGRSAVFVTKSDTSIACSDGIIRVRITDGFPTATQTASEGSPGLTAGLAAIYAPAASSTLTTFETVALSGSGKDADGADAGRLVWSLQSGGSTEVPVAEGENPLVTPPAGGFPSGPMTFTLRAYATQGTVDTNDDTLLGSASRTVTVLLDSDGDGIPDDAEDPDKNPCYAADAATDPTNALIDSDLDGIANIDDPAPCQSINSVAIAFNPQSLYKSSSGRDVTVYLSSAAVDLRSLQRSDIYITQIAGYSTTRLAGSSTALPAVAWEVSGAGTATAKFNRAALTSALGKQPNLLGYVPIFVGTLDHALRGTDPLSPHVFP